jgi:Kinesin-like protein
MKERSSRFSSMQCTIPQIRSRTCLTLKVSNITCRWMLSSILTDHAVAPTVKHLFNGFDVTIFAYGVTGTGKTHTMRGGKSLADRGVIPRLLSAIYRRSRKLDKDSDGQTKVDVSMSYYEIYNDKVFDLFEPPEKRTASGLPLRDNGGKTVVVGLTERPCPSLKEFESLYDQANMNRSTSATKVSSAFGFALGQG